MARAIFYGLFYAIFGIGAGIRYIYFRLRGKKRTFDDLIAPNAQGLWNILISAIVVGVFLYLVVKYDAKLEDRHPPIEVLMNKKY